MPFPDVLETRRLLIRSADPETAAVVNSAVRESYETLHAWMPWADHLPSVDETRQHLVRARADARLGTDYGLFIWDRATAGFLGAVGLHQRLPEPARREIGYWLRDSAVGMGYAVEAVEAVTRAALISLGLEAVEIRTSSRNLASQRVAVRAGFVLIAVREDGRVDPGGKPSATHVYERRPDAPDS